MCHFPVYSRRFQSRRFLIHSSLIHSGLLHIVSFPIRDSPPFRLTSHLRRSFPVRSPPFHFGSSNSAPFLFSYVHHESKQIRFPSPLVQSPQFPVPSFRFGSSPRQVMSLRCSTSLFRVISFRHNSVTHRICSCLILSSPSYFFSPSSRSQVNRPFPELRHWLNPRFFP